MAAAIGILDYAGPAPTSRRTFLDFCRAFIQFWLSVVLPTLVIIVRAMLLVLGFFCIAMGTILLGLGGLGSAKRDFANWRRRTRELLRVWMNDLLRPWRNWRALVA